MAEDPERYQPDNDKAARKNEPQLEMTVESRRHLDIIERHVLRGITNTRTLAAGLGISEREVRRLIECLKEEWKNSDPERADFDRGTRIRQLDGLLNLAITGYERSRHDNEEFTIIEKSCNECKGTGKDQVKKNSQIECTECGGQGVEEHLPGKYKRCEKCHGSGLVVDGPDCAECGGKGKIVLETTKVKQQAGDPAFLNVAKGLIVEAAKLQGLAPNNGVAALRFASEAAAMGGEIGVRVTEMYLDAPPDVLVQALALIDRLDSSVKKGTTKKVVIDVEANQ